MKTLITACEFYEADWCGILLLDLDIGVWRPYWWYDVKRGAMADTAFHEFEFSEEFGRWVTALKAGDPVIIEDVDALRETNPAEYRNYKRLEASSIIGVPFWKRPTGFIVIRNPKRNKVDPNMLRIMAYADISTTLNIYADVTKDLKKAEFEGLDKWFAKSMGQKNGDKNTGPETGDREEGDS